MVVAPEVDVEKAQHPHAPAQAGAQHRAEPATRVLVGDMADEGLVMVHRPAQAGDRPDLALLERVLYGLKTI